MYRSDCSCMSSSTQHWGDRHYLIIIIIGSLCIRGHSAVVCCDEIKCETHSNKCYTGTY